MSLVMLAWPLLVALLAQAPQSSPSTTIAGQIHTRDGAPVVAIRVSVIVAAPPDARPEDGIQYYLDPPPVATTLTNAQGRFRLPAIPPGRYVIVAGIQGRATYFPSATEAMRATVVTVGGGAATDNLEITLAQAIGGRVRGTITPPPPDAKSEIAVLSGQQFTELVEMPVAADGSFDFGHVPSGRYLLNFFPTPPGGRSVSFVVGTGDIPPIQYTRPPTHAVTGRLIVEKGPLPSAILLFRTDDNYATATINPDGTFTTRLQAGQHVADLGGMPVGYDVRSVRIGNTDAAKGIAVGNADVSNVMITVKTPVQLPSLKGRVTGAPAKATVQLTGPIVGSVSAPIGADGSFTFPALVPGLYYARVAGAPALGTTLVVVTAHGDNETVIGTQPPGRP
jgi:hypothetical protein